MVNEINHIVIVISLNIPQIIIYHTPTPIIRATAVEIDSHMIILHRDHMDIHVCVILTIATENQMNIMTEGVVTLCPMIP